MAVMPGAHFTNAATGPAMSRYDVLCVHTIVGYAPANAAHFSTRADGYVWQSRDTRWQSAANYIGNPRVIAIENEDFGPRYGAWSSPDVPAFTPEQAESIAQIAAWVNRTHGIPLVPCLDSKPGSRGIAYHRQGIDGNWSGFAYSGRVAGGEVWTLTPGKVCPGDRRITQLLTQIIPRARQLAGLDPGGFLMALTDKQQTDLYNRVFGITDPQRYWATDKNGEVVEVASGAVGAKPARVLDTLDGNYLVGELDAVRTQVEQATQAAMSAAQAAVAAASKIDRISTGGVDLGALAAAVADELDRRARDNDPDTGPRS